ncbi:MAG: DEAD/DEAH box helicase [Alphaproteobacteria bacterium]|nr:DEAD/DEAH box helicase [Alphaproteobacteria bacterium]
MAQTIQETIKQLHHSLRDYIEATYHISDPALIEQRKRLLDKPGIIHQVPYLESTPRYKSGAIFASMNGLSPAALEVYQMLSKPDATLPQILYDPPYKHQSEAIQGSLIDGRNLLIMTGTGSGKTESFLLPIIGKLANEAESSPKSFSDDFGIRALVLYPMNALVNDQLGRMRSLFGDPRVVNKFRTWAGRPPRFARYTSRTPYAGVRTSKKDSNKLMPFDSFYVEIQRLSKESPSDEQRQASAILEQLKKRGKWPAKPDLPGWFGKKGSPWQERKSGEWLRAVTLPEDTELLTRHEAQVTAPDLLVTNYSMLEYMLMRPIERTIFDQTKEWLRKNPKEKFLVVLDEAHLYRGAAGAEVGLLLRRLRDRLGIPPERFQVICATASFTNKDYAADFGAQLAGVPASTFTAITGDLDLRSPDGAGTADDANILAAVDIAAFNEGADTATRAEAIKPFLAHQGVAPTGDYERDLYDALKSFAPLGRLVNKTMKQAMPVAELSKELFPGASHAEEAVSALMTLGSTAKKEPNGPSLLPCRIHNFFRGLPGLWACLDPDCSEVPKAERSGICGKLYGQPREQCDCGSRVLEFYSCRYCGTAYARAYSDDVDSPTSLWSEAGRRLRMDGGETNAMLPLDLLLEQPSLPNLAEAADYDLETGRLNPNQHSKRMRTVHLRRDRITPAVDEDGDQSRDFESRGQFAPCACCGKTAKFGYSYVQDHQTKGDQPFEALVSTQIQIQPPSPVKATKFAPLRGRKVLVFSDSRQVAARLAPNLQMYSVRDSLRPLIVWGYRELSKSVALKNLLSLEDVYLAVLLASKKLGVRLRPELKQHESFDGEETVEAAVASGAASSENGLLTLGMQFRSEKPPEALLDDIINTIQNPFLGLEPLALASLCETTTITEALTKLPDIPGIADTPQTKVELTRAWLRCWRNFGFWLNAMPSTWFMRPRAQGTSVRGKKGKGKFDAMDVILTDRGTRKIFNDYWTPELVRLFTQDTSGFLKLQGSKLALDFDGPWVRCSSCKSVHRPVSTIAHCLDCGRPTVAPLDPTNDPAFLARKGYYRAPVMASLADPPRQPMALIAAEHTAQLNSPQNEDVFSKAEENELLFQDVSVTWGRNANRASAIDVLSSTTTMEVGIDIGALSGVALRNMPPGRANYQQRAGRAGRRGNAVATVVAFGSADSHDEHYFVEPDAMIRGDVVDPRLTLNNRDITQRHIRAFLLQNYHQDRLPDVDPAQNHDLFSVLGDVADFRNGTALLNRADFAKWLKKNETDLRKRIDSWIPEELSKEDRAALLGDFISDCLKAVDRAIKFDSNAAVVSKDEEVEEGEEAAEEGEEKPIRNTETGKLLDRLLYSGVLPRYAFPTDVATFHVFDRARSSKFRAVMRFAPSQGLPIALSQYAPGKQIWISGKCYSSGAVYSPMRDDRDAAWENGKRLYWECGVCEFAQTTDYKAEDKGATVDCPACGTKESFGPSRSWLRPPGFAHPVDVEEVTSPDDVPETSYATRAKLTMKTPDHEYDWTPVNARVGALKVRDHLLVSNSGPKSDGYSYCVKCGRIEAATEEQPKLFSAHPKPYPDEKEETCSGDRTAQHIVLGTDFITDVVLFSLKVAAPLQLLPGQYPTDVALRTVSEALAKAACDLLEIEPGELMAEYRPALTRDGRLGKEAEIFLYDTLPGGAGFASQLVDRGQKLFERALHLMKSCPEQCDASCYRCLRSFKNKFEHGLLDRHVGAELLEYLLTGHLPGFNAERLESSTKLLFADLQRQGRTDVIYKENETIKVNGKDVVAPILAERGGKKFIVALAAPLTSAHPADPRIAAIKDASVAIIVENELLARGNLPTTTRNVELKLTL